MASDKLTRKQIAQLGGLARQRQLGAEGRTQLGKLAGAATLEKHGREHYILAAHKRWGRLGGKSNG